MPKLISPLEFVTKRNYLLGFHDLAVHLASIVLAVSQ
jgi:hypothetical protein